MAVKTNKLINVFDTCTQKAPAMTHALSELGNGDMGKGIISMWQAGRIDGFIQGVTITSVCFMVGIGTYKAVAYFHRTRRIKRLLQEECENVQCYLLAHS